MSKRQRRRTERRRRHQLATGAGVTVGATLLMGGAAQAATLTVGSTDDTTGATDCAVATNTDCTLRDAIEDANATPASTIVFASALSGDTVTLGGTELPQITAYSTTVQGPSGGITVDANYTSRVFNVSASDATLSDLTIQHGKAGLGGGIYLQAGNLTVEKSTVTGNEATGVYGGGIFVHTGNLMIDSTTISDNESGDRGGGIGDSASTSAHAGTTTIRNSTLSGNSAPHYGGAVYFNYQSAATVKNSTVYDNYSGSVGGGLYHFGQGGGGTGLVVTGSTITTNYAAHRGSGVGGADSVGYKPPTIEDSIVSDNETTDGPGSDISADSGSMDVGFSLIGSADPNTTINATGPNLIGQDPQLGALAGHGGPTETQKPAATSPVIDAGSAFGLSRDQRGQARPFDAPTIGNAADGTDIGAIELQAGDVPAAPVTPAPPATTTPGATTKKKCKKHKKKHKRSAQSAKKKKCKKKKKKR